VLRALDRLDDLRDASRFRSWFFAILLSVHRQRHRRAFWRRLLPLDAVREPPGSPEAERLEGAERMAAALASLSAKEREAVVLFELEGFTLEEIAALSGDSLSAVKSRLSRARLRLRRHYERDATHPLLLEKTP
jgi:RNA polymerase sigma-70 factor (ECF subfamily)